MPLPLTSRLQQLLKTLESDIRDRLKEDAALTAPLRADYDAEFEAKATRQDFSTWLQARITQSAVAWILATVFVRFLEDNHLVTPARLLTPVGSDNDSPAERWEMFIAAQPTANRRDWMLSEFRELSRLPALSDLLGEANTHLWTLAPSQDGVQSMFAVFSERTPDGTALLWSFEDQDLGTRFLGDLYQDLSDDAKKRFALLQTPDFVEEFILDRTLEPALETFGLYYKDEHGGFRLIDPTVGSGHFLLGALPRILRLWQEAEPATDIRILAQRTLDSLHGVDLNPFAVAIARFRLLIAALKACGITRLTAAPDFRMQLAVGDSLLLRTASETDTTGVQISLDRDDVVTVLATHPRYEPARRILAKGFHAVVGNPPYIIPPKDLNAAYRELYGSCTGKYPLTCPFMERFVELALPARGASPAGFVGKITSNSFAKREFGKKLVNDFFAKWDLTTVVDTSGAYIPGHGTPTVMLFFRNRLPTKATVRAVLGIRGEPSTPVDPPSGLVWRAIVDQIERPGSQSQFVSVEDRDRQMFCVHPCSLSGGGSGAAKAAIDRSGALLVGELADSIGFASFPGLDDAFVMSGETLSRKGIDLEYRRGFLAGDTVRDWSAQVVLSALVPYGRDLTLVALEPRSAWARHLWPLRASLGNVVSFGGKTRNDLGERWWGWYRWVPEKYRAPLSIVFAEIATHNHFVLDRGGRVFKNSAPVIKLRPGATEDDHLALLGVLNSSAVLFYCRQVCHNKGGGGIGGGLASEGWEKFVVFNATAVGLVPIPTDLASALVLAAALDRIGQALSGARTALNATRNVSLIPYAALSEKTLVSAIALQEELDWLVYRLYEFRGGTALEWPDLDALPPVRLGERAFEIVMARKMVAGELETNWFERHGSTPITEVPLHWPETYRELVRARIAAIENDSLIGLIEQPEFKRRWNHEPWEETWRSALTERFLNAVEALHEWRAEQPTPITVARLADILANDAEAVEIAEHLTGAEAPDMAPFLVELLATEHVPCSAGSRYTDSGLLKRVSWETTWDLQRKEDALFAFAEAGQLTADDAKTRTRREVSDIPVPPRYDAKDFRSTVYWQARGKLDVPKERFISYPFAGGDKPADLMLGWAGWDHFQQAQALMVLINRGLDQGESGERLLPLLQGLAELLPWLSQWFGNHSEFGDLGEVFRNAWLDALGRAGVSAEDVQSWRLPKTAKGKTSKIQKSKKEPVAVESDEPAEEGSGE